MLPNIFLPFHLLSFLLPLVMFVLWVLKLWFWLADWWLFLFGVLFISKIRTIKVRETAQKANAPALISQGPRFDSWNHMIPLTTSGCNSGPSVHESHQARDLWVSPGWLEVPEHCEDKQIMNFHEISFSIYLLTDLFHKQTMCPQCPSMLSQGKCPFYHFFVISLYFHFHCCYCDIS